MSKLVSKTIVAAMLAGCFAASAFAQSNGTPSSKATADINTLVKCTMSTATSNDGGAQIPQSCVNLYTGAEVATQNEWVTIMEKPVKLSNSQSLVVSPSLVTGLYTQTRTKTSTNSTSTAQAMGGVYMKAVLTDDAGNEIVAAPLSSCSSGVLGCQEVAGDWGVQLDTRIQTLTQSLSTCTVMDMTGTTQIGTCDFTSIIDLVLNTTSAHTFNFVFPNVGQGVYTLSVKAAVASGASVIGSGTAVGAAAFGLGSMIAESVRFVHDFEF
ncbi:hypothetical protein GPA22_18755 [Aromatoleum toluvorans]|uniref:Uncharacterized protein n=1 Tax=Aromatoleum toluvorans TaxID=92002 RepID=A0ABX1Q4T0_9RHOO|nr:hypothetical protein [Aromatoleum toluvorans]NMG45761.1 hypothetical protein [Aromatoleum toluvorans]